MINLAVNGFLSGRSALNALRRLEFSRLAIIRCYITSNGPFADVVRSQGILHIVERATQAFNYLRLASGEFGYTERYYGFEKSDKDAISYRTGEALLKMFCERHLSIPHILKLPLFTAAQIRMSAGQVSAKPTLGTTSKAASAPDFIGIDTNQCFHALETKGRAKYLKSEHQHALNQVSCVNLINGKPPETRVAAYFAISRKRTIGHIIDPASNGTFDIDFEYNDFLRGYYRYFLDFDSENSLEVIYRNRTFLVSPFIAPGYFIGIDQGVKRAAARGETDKTYQSWFREQLADNQVIRDTADEEYISVGLDGIAVLAAFNGFNLPIQVKLSSRTLHVLWYPWLSFL